MPTRLGRGRWDASVRYADADGQSGPGAVVPFAFAFVSVGLVTVMQVCLPSRGVSVSGFFLDFGFGEVWVWVWDDGCCCWVGDHADIWPFQRPSSSSIAIHRSTAGTHCTLLPYCRLDVRW